MEGARRSGRLAKGEMASSDDRRETFERLKPGRHALSRDEVDDIQRARIVSAMVEVAADVGYLGAAVAPVVARAGISRRTFYELFEGREDCFLAAFDWAVEQAAGFASNVAAGHAF